MGFFRRLFDAMLFRPVGSNTGSGTTRREFLVTVQGAAVGTFLLPVVTGDVAAVGAVPPTRRVLGRVNKLDVGGQFSLLWTELGDDGKPRVMVWNPETRQEVADARRFYDAGRGVGRDAPAGRRIRRGSAVERTPEEHEYLAAIRNRPDDPQPYLDYAEWLEGRGDPYGSFIRVCVELEGPKDPPGDDPLWATSQALVEAHAETWMKPLIGLGFQPEIMGIRTIEVWLTKFGTIQDFTIDRPGVLPENVGRFFAAVPLIRKLLLSDDDIDFGGVCHLPQMAQIEELTCRHVTPAQFLTACRSPHLGKLRKLDAWVQSGRDDRLGEAGGRALAAAPWLHQLDWLALTRSGLGDDGVRAFAESPAVARLKSLDLSNCGEYGPGFVALANSPHLAGLEVLNWSGNHVSPEALGALATAKFRSNLRDLNLNFCGSLGLGRAAFEQLAAANLPRLEVLDISTGRLNDGGMAALAAAPWLAGLKDLNVAGSETGDTELAELARLHLPKLERLKLDLNPFGDVGLAALCRGPAWPGLKKFELVPSPESSPGSPPPGPEGARAFAESTRFPNLEEVDLRRVEIGDAGASALAKSAGLSKLKKLAVSEDQVGPAGKAALQRRFGDGLSLC